MTVGVTPKQADLLRGSASVVGDRVAPDSIWGVLHREGHRLFPDELFADLFSDKGRRSVPPQVVATVMVLQRLHGKSDREAVECFEFDVRWKYAAGGLDLDFPGFVHTVLVDMRARLARSQRPRRVFEATLDAASAAGLVGLRRVLDSTPLYDAVATMDTITLIRSAIAQLLEAADHDLAVELRAVLGSGDDYASRAKPQIDWDDQAAREALVDSRARDAFGCLMVLDGRGLDPDVAEAAALLARVVAQDLDEGDDGVFRIARRVAADRVISTIDPDARHGHKTAARGFDGYKGHVAADPDTEIITNTTVTPGNAGDASVAEDLIDDLITSTGDGDSEPAPGDGTSDSEPAPGDGDGAKPKVYGDAAYGTGEFQEFLEDNDIDSGCKTQPPTPPAGGRFAKDRFDIDLDDDTVTCPNQVTVKIRRGRDGGGIAHFTDACAACALRDQCTNSQAGRTITISPHEAALARARHRNNDPDWRADYRATRPKIERKLGHLMFRRHGGRRARVRGRPKVDADFNLLAAAANLARLATLGARSTPTGWATTKA